MEERSPRHSKNGILPISILTFLSPIVASIQCIYSVDLASIHSFLKYTVDPMDLICNQVLINTILNDI